MTTFLILMNFNNHLSDVIINIGTTCKNKRKHKGLTQLDLAFLSEVETSTISKIERFAIDNVSLRTLVKISLILEIDIKDFFIN